MSDRNNRIVNSDQILGAEQIYIKFISSNNNNNSNNNISG